MSLKPSFIEPVPAETDRIARAAFPNSQARKDSVNINSVRELKEHSHKGSGVGLYVSQDTRGYRKHIYKK